MTFEIPQHTHHSTLVGLVVGEVTKQCIHQNVTVDYNIIVDSLDNYLCNYTDAYGFIDDENISKELYNFLEQDVLINCKINATKIISELRSHFAVLKGIF